MILRIRILILLLLCARVTFAQELVVNGDFEQENICTEYHQNCSPAGWRNTAHLPFGYQRQPVKAYEGEHYLPIVAEDLYVSNFRTYWQTRLKCPLQKGAVYKISFYAGALGSKFIANNLAVHFSPDELNQLKIWPLKVQPSVRLTNKNVSGVKESEWLRVEAEYTANGDELFLVIGNFYTDDEMTRHRKPSLQKITYCIDGLSVRKTGDSVNCETSPEVLEWLAGKDRHTPVLQRAVVKKSPPAEIKKPVEEKPVPARIDTLVLPDVLFRFNSGSLTVSAYQVLDTIVTRLQQTPFKKIRVEGHTDSLGTNAYNLDLSGRRASSVMEYFKRKGLNTQVIEAAGKGEAYPVASNKSDEGRKRNRRVEILIEY